MRITSTRSWIIGLRQLLCLPVPAAACEDQQDYDPSGWGSIPCGCRNLYHGS